MSRESFIEKARNPDWDRKVNLPDGTTGTFIKFEREIEYTYGKEKKNYGSVIDLKPKEPFVFVNQDPLGNEVKVPLDKFYEVN